MTKEKTSNYSLEEVSSAARNDQKEEIEFQEKQQQVIKNLNMESILDSLVSESNEDTDDGLALRKAFGHWSGNLSLEKRSLSEKGPEFILFEEHPETKKPVPILAFGVFSISEKKLKNYKPFWKELEKREDWDEEVLYVISAWPKVIDGQLRPDMFIDYTIYYQQSPEEFIQGLKEYASGFNRSSTAANYDRREGLSEKWVNVHREAARRDDRFAKARIERSMERNYFGKRVYTVFGPTFRSATGIEVY